MAGLKEVAERARVSMTTASRFLSGDKSLAIAEETKERINEAVKYYQYKPGSIRKRYNKNLGLIVMKSEQEELEDPYFRSIRIGILEEIKKKGLTLQLQIQKGETFDREKIASLGGILIVGSFEHQFLRELRTVNPNIVLLDDRLSPPEFDAVYADMENATIDLLEGLYQKGHRRIIFMGGCKMVYQENGQIDLEKNEDIRYQVYQKWMEQKGLSKYAKGFIGEWSSYGGDEMTGEALRYYEKQPFPTAILSASDPISVGVYRRLQKSGVKIPDEVSIVSFDNTEMSEFMVPALTSANMHQREIGHQGVRMAWGRITEERDYPIKIVIPAEIIHRDSEKELQSDFAENVEK